MPIEISGTTGISGVDGSNASPAIQGSDSNTGLSFGSDTVNINTGGVTRATVDSAGRMLIGTSTESNTNLTIFGDNTGDNKPAVIFQNPSTGTGSTNGFYVGGASNDTTGYVWNYENSNVVLGTNNTERMRIDSSGRLLLGDTSPTTGVSTGHIVSTYNGNSDNGIKTRDTSGGSCNHAVFVSQSTAVGTISGTSSAVAYNNLSDYRTKENDVKISDGITKLKLLRPIRFNFKHVPDTTVDGFFAHEVTPAVPEAVTGEKDAVDSNGEINPQMLDSSKLVPLLTAALQEAIAKIEVLETKVAALEAG